MLKKIRNLITMPTVLVLMVATGTALPAAADHGNSDSTTATTTDTGGSDATSTSSDPSSTSKTDASSTSETEHGTETEALTEHDLNQKGNDMVRSLLAKHKNRQSDVARQRKCQAAKHGLETKLSNLQKNAAKHKALLDSTYGKVLTYQQQNNLNPANFDTLKAAADAAQAKAAASVSALDNLSVNLDCANTSVAANVASFKVAAQQAQSDLLAYRKAVVALIQTLQSAKQP